MRIPVGISNFRKLIADKDPETGEKYLYIDKTLMIGDILSEPAEVILITRPRRFGKTLNMSMLQYFCAKEVEGEKTEGLFDGLLISKNEAYMQHQGKYPVIFVSFKGLKFLTFEGLLEGMTTVIRNMFNDHKYTFPDNEPLFERYVDTSKIFNVVEMAVSLSELSRYLHKYSGERVLILIDEYDAPLQTGYLNGYYEEAAALMRNMFENALKDNSSLHKGILTGITRVAKSNLFSGLNHFETYGIDQKLYSQYFGFDENEILQFCLAEHLEDLKRYYNGYTFGARQIYNPWSALLYVKSGFEYAPYWIHSAENRLIQKSITSTNMTDVQNLIDGGTVSIKINNDLILKHLDTNKGAFFNLLYTAGYLTSAGPSELEGETLLCIPNREVKEFFETTVIDWFAHGEGEEFLKEFLAALIDGEEEEVQHMLTDVVKNEVSFQDATKRKQESFYHGVLLGITLGARQRYKVRSNRESGKGRFDLALFPKNPARDPGIVIEIKTRGSATQALDQIEAQDYAQELKADGCKTILLYGVRFSGKKAEVKMVTEVVA